MFTPNKGFVKKDPGRQLLNMGLRHRRRSGFFEQKNPETGVNTRLKPTESEIYSPRSRQKHDQCK